MKSAGKKGLSINKLLELQQAKDYLDNIIDSSLDSIVISDPMGYITRANESFLKLRGYKEEEIIGKHITEFSVTKEGTYESTSGELIEIGKAYVDAARDTIYKNLFEKGKVSAWETYIFHKNGKVIAAEENIVLMYNKKGEVIGAFGVIRDITDRVKAEREIKEAKQFLENIFKTSVDGILVTDNKGVITMVNDAAEKMLGYSKTDLIGKHSRQLSPKGKHYEEEGIELVKELHEKGTIIGRERVCLRKDGSLINIEQSTAFLRDKKGNLTGSIGSIRDISERKKAEDRLQASEMRARVLLNVPLDAILLIDNKGTILDCNQIFSQRFNKSINELIGSVCWDLYPPDLVKRRKKLLDKAIQSGEPIRFEDQRQGRYLDNAIYPIIDMQGTVTNCAIFSRDITDRKLLEKSLNKVYMCILSFGPNGDENIKKIVETAGFVLEGVCALYNKEEGTLLSTEEGWNIPRDSRKKDKKEGHICYDVIKKHENKPFIINNLDKSPYAKTDPNVTKYKLKTYIGSAVKMGDKAIGSLCVVYHKNRTFNSNELNILSILTQALGIEEERKKTLEELKYHQQKLEVSERSIKEFSRKILSVREEEKRILSHSLHDELGCMSIALRSNLFLLKEEIKDNHLQKAMDRINQTENALVQSVEKLKAIYKDLRPPDLDIVGLPNSLRQYFSDTRKQAKIKIDFRENIDEQKIDDEAAIILYRVTQEAINNILKHARAKKVKARLYSEENNITLTISDDGRGFDVERRLPKTKGLGIRGMIEMVSSLGGTLIIKSAVQKGTEIRTTIPTKQQRGV